MSGDTQSNQPTVVEMIADLACPWCYIGFVRLEKAFALRPEINVELRWWPYLLNPQLPREGMDRQTYLRSKFGGDEKAAQIYQRIGAAGMEEGIPFAFDRMTRTPNTVTAQRFVLLAQSEGKGALMIRTLFKALFEDGVDIGRADSLSALAKTVGLEPPDTARVIEGDDYGADIIRGHQRATMMGVQGVPVYLAGGEHAISGAQAPEVLAGLLDIARVDAVA